MERSVAPLYFAPLLHPTRVFFGVFPGIFGQKVFFFQKIPRKNRNERRETTPAEPVQATLLVLFFLKFSGPFSAKIIFSKKIPKKNRTERSSHCAAQNVQCL